MTFDYGPIIGKAQAAVEKYGRTVTLVKFDTGVDTEAPWRADDTPVETKLVTKAVGFPPSQGGGMGIDLTDLVKRCSEFFLIATTADISAYNALDDSLGPRRMTIEGMQRIAPGDTHIVWIVGVKQ